MIDTRVIIPRLMQCQQDCVRTQADPRRGSFSSADGPIWSRLTQSALSKAGPRCTHFTRCTPAAPHKIFICIAWIDCYRGTERGFAAFELAGGVLFARVPIHLTPLRSRFCLSEIGLKKSAESRAREVPGNRLIRDNWLHRNRMPTMIIFDAGAVLLCS